MYTALIHWLENHTISCVYKKWLGVPCPGCGLQSALLALLKGQLSESLQLFPALIPLLFTLLFLIIHLVFKLRNGNIILRFSAIFTSLIMMIHYILSIIHQIPH